MKETSLTNQELLDENSRLTRRIQELQQAYDNMAAGTKELQHSEEKYRLLFASAGDAIFVNDEQTRILAANPFACELLGYTHAEMMLMNASQVDSKAEYGKASFRAARLMELGSLTFETEHQRKDGSLVPTEVTARLISWEGKPAIMSICRDLTERKQVERALAAEKERLAVTLRSIGDGVITTDTQGNVVIMNEVAEKFTGWLQSEAQGKTLTTVFRIINEGTRLPCENPAEKVLTTGGIIELANHTLLVSRDGTERIISDSGAPIMGQDGVIIGVVLVFRDMTEKQKLFTDIQRADKLDSLGVLAGGIAHDFNNLLAGIFGYIDLALASTTDAKITGYLDKAMSVFSRAKDLTQQLLTFSKGGAPQRKKSELGSLIRDCASFALSGSNVACDYVIDKDLWLADFDKNQIGQVIDNLVINAQHAMPMGGRIVISAKNFVIKDGENPLLKAGMFIKLSIADTGIGIQPDLLKRIFDPFFTTKQKGHGLGLATCYAIVQKHDGCIEVESVMGKGSTFHVFLPASQQETEQSVSQISISHKGSGRILIMDDEPSIKDILGYLLKEMGYTILEAKDGEEALRLFAEAASKGTPIDGAFFDLTIPGGMGGKETIVQLRKQYPNIPVYASSGYSENPVMARPTEYGFTDSLRKPYRKDELAAMLNRHASKDVI
ncbi:MAG: PAS domain S-box protein [Candidatus Riflebacteria bacterium]|nr:PAS domain S-box protein [Candidatus Riflebacteria bacterium]